MVKIVRIPYTKEFSLKKKEDGNKFGCFACTYVSENFIALII